MQTQKTIGTRLFNWLKRPLILAFLALSCLYLFQRMHLFPSFGNWFKKKPLLIENTPLVITQIKNIAELQTIQMYADVVADSSIYTDAGIANQALKNMGMFTLPLAEKRVLVLIIKGKVIAGINLKNLKEEQVFFKDDSVSIKLPKAEILDVITNPADMETFIENGTWTDDEVRAVKNSARGHLVEEANKQQLLKQATDRSKMIIEAFLKTAGFTKIHIDVVG